jgi:hypothetical protein
VDVSFAIGNCEPYLKSLSMSISVHSLNNVWFNNETGQIPYLIASSDERDILLVLTGFDSTLHNSLFVICYTFYLTQKRGTNCMTFRLTSEPNLNSASSSRTGRTLALVVPTAVDEDEVVLSNNELAASMPLT